MEPNIEARQILNANYKQLMSAFSSIYTQLEFGETGSPEKLAQIAAYYTVVFFKTKTLPPIVTHIDLYMSKNPELTLSDSEQSLASEIVVENHIHELKIEGFIEIKTNEEGLIEINLTDKGKKHSKKIGKDIRLL